MKPINCCNYSFTDLIQAVGLPTSYKLIYIKCHKMNVILASKCYAKTPTGFRKKWYYLYSIFTRSKKIKFIQYPS